MKNILILLLFAILLCNGCKDEPTPPEQFPEGYQQDIPWPSLADSPWPMNHHDPQSTGRSKYSGPQFGILAGLVPCEAMVGGIAIGLNSIVYANSSSELFSFGYDGHIIWSDTIGYEISAAPLILSDGTIISSDGIRSLFAAQPDGKIKWKYTTTDRVRALSMNVDKQGNIYFLERSDPSTLHVLDNEGKLLWKLIDGRLLSTNDSAPVFSPDGNTLYIQGNNVNVIAVNIVSHSVEWTFGNTTLKTSPIVDSQGNIYVYPTYQENGMNYFYSLKPNGDVRWKFEYSGYPFITDNIEPTIDKFGNVYFGYDTLYSLDYEGKLRWKKGFTKGKNYSPIVCDSKDNIYLGLSSGQDNQRIVCYAANGDEVYTTEIPIERAFGTSPAITENGKMFYPTFRSKNILIIN